jgi:hypothetical protein
VCPFAFIVRGSTITLFQILEHKNQKNIIFSPLPEGVPLFQKFHIVFYILTYIPFYHPLYFLFFYKSFFTKKNGTLEQSPFLIPAEPFSVPKANGFSGTTFGTNFRTALKVVVADIIRLMWFNLFFIDLQAGFL